MRFSLITATLNRTIELVALLESLSAQTFCDFEVIIVDQNEGDRLVPILHAFPNLRLTHLRCTVKALSAARNLGIAACTGEFIGFPDDDCLYQPDTLARVHARFAAEPDLAVLSGPAIASDGQLSSGRWSRSAGQITLMTVWTTVIAFNLFIRRAEVTAVGGFDEALGVGARFGSAEETDLTIRLIRAGRRGVYDPGLRVIHPQKQLTLAATARAFSYGAGLGRVLRKHQVAKLIAWQFFLRPAGGVLWSLARLRLLHVKYYWRTLLGRLSGYFTTIAQ